MGGFIQPWLIRHKPRTAALILFIYAQLAGGVGLTSAEEPAPLQQAAPDSIEGVIEQRDELVYDPRRRSLFPDFYYSFRKKQLDWWNRHRVEFTLTYDVLAQAYNDRDVSVNGTAGDLTLGGSWLIAGERFKKPIYLTFRVRDRRAYSEFAPSEIREQTDLLWGTVNGFTDAGFQVPDLYLDQRLFDDKLALRYGQFSIDNFVDKHALRSAKRFFLNQAFSDNPTVNFPSYGAGLTMYLKPSDVWEIAAGISNIQGVEGDEQVDFQLDSDALFGTVQAAYHFKGIGKREARLQVMGWGGDENSVDEYEGGTGLSVTLEHGGRAKHETLVVRYAQNDGDPTNTDALVFLGYGREIRGFDSLGFGIGSGRSSTSSKWQTVVETYYRWQATKELVITPDLQMIFGDDQEGENKVRVVGGIRVGVVF